MNPITALLPNGISSFPDQSRRQYGWLTSVMCMISIFKTQQLYQSSPMSQNLKTTITSNMADQLPCGVHDQRFQNSTIVFVFSHVKILKYYY